MSYLETSLITWEGWSKYIKGDTKKGEQYPSVEYDLRHMLLSNLSMKLNEDMMILNHCFLISICNQFYD